MKAARESRGVTLDEMCAATRISVRLLGAIESERFELLPGGVFSISFVRQYARYVELDEDEAADEFKAAAVQREPVIATMERTRQGIVGDEPEELAGARIAESITEYLRRHGQTLAGAVAVLVIAVVTIWYFRAERAGEDEAMQARRPVVTAPASTESTQADFRTVSQPAQQEVSLKPLNVVIRTTREVWIRALADGRRVFERTFEPGQIRQIEADTAVRLRVGNAGGLDVVLNGRTLDPIGPLGHVREVIITEGGMEVIETSLSSRSQGDAVSANSVPSDAAAREAQRRLAQAEPQ
jgi:transcriptional regulator with XRE-family HTH domain